LLNKDYLSDVVQQVSMPEDFLLGRNKSKIRNEMSYMQDNLLIRVLAMSLNLQTQSLSGLEDNLQTNLFFECVMQDLELLGSLKEELVITVMSSLGTLAKVYYLHSSHHTQLIGILGLWTSRRKLLSNFCMASTDDKLVSAFTATCNCFD